jgi:glycosyltransferase involved in cell wall biosynthesis
VVICTHNRCTHLAETLTALTELHTPGFGFEVLVIDNGSTDDTQTVVTSFQPRLKARLDYVFEARLGLSIARNVAIDHVTTPYVAFLDDDSPPSSSWLVNLLEPFFSIVPRPAAVGGRVLLRWSAQQPAWMPDELLGLYSHLDYGDKLQPVRMVNGCKVAFPTDLLRYYRYDPRLGLVGKRQILGEDADILRRMRADKHEVYFQPSAVVTHIVGQYRENRQYLWRRSRGAGQQQAFLSVIYQWPGRGGILRLMWQDAWFRRNWWKRLAIGFTGKLWRSPTERTWACASLIRFFEFQRQMALFALKGASAIPAK